MKFLIVAIFPLLINAQEISIDSLANKVDNYINQNIDSALIINDIYLSRSKIIDTSDYHIIQAIDNYAKIYSRKGEFIKGAEKAKILIKENKLDIQPEGLSSLYNRIGICFVRTGAFDSTITYFKKALKIRKTLNDSIGIGASLNNIGMVSSEKSDYLTSMEYLNQALRIREKLKDTAGISSTNNNLGLIFYHQNRFEEAIEFYKIARKYIRLPEDQGKEILVLNNIGNLYDEIGKLDSSLVYYLIALEKANTFGDKRKIAISLGNLGATYSNLNKIYAADSLYKKAIQLRIEMDDKHGLATIYNQIASLDIKKKDYKNSIIHFNLSLENAFLTDAKFIVRDNYLGLSSAHQKLGNYEEAFNNQVLHLVYKDSVFNSETTEKIEEIQTKYDTEKKRKTTC